jgi:hypothetical protein
MDEPTYDWSTAPQQMREAFERMQSETKALRETNEKAQARLLAVDRRETFERVKGELGDVAKDVSLEDLGDLPLEQITPTTLKVKAQEKAEARTLAEVQIAKDLGFESVDEFRTFRAEREAAKAQTQQAMGITAAAATAGQSFIEPVLSPKDAAFAAFNEAKTKGLPSDDAKAAAVSALLRASSK